MDHVKRLQLFDPEKLNELCRMHLCFTLDLHNDEFASLMELKGNKKKTTRYFTRLMKDKSTGGSLSLSQEMVTHIYQIIEFLGREINVTVEGLFRKTGSLARQNELKALLKVGETINFASGHFTAHDCACVLKSFLADLPEPLLSEAHYSAHCQITDMCKNMATMSSSQLQKVFERQLKSTKLLLLLLATENYRLLKYLLLLLYQIQNAQDKNKMSSENLATLFAPHILCPRKMPPEILRDKYPRLVKCINFLIRNAPVLFEPPVELVQDVIIHLNELPLEGQIQDVPKENQPVKTMITFCDRTPVSAAQSTNYTSKALADLQSYIETLPDSNRKRKLIKKLQKESNVEPVVEPRRKHFRSRSVGDALKKHLLKGSMRRKEGDFCHSTFEMNNYPSKSTESIPSSSAKSASMEALYLDGKESTKFSDLRKNFLRASRKKAQKLVRVN